MYFTATDKRRALQKLAGTGVNGTVDRRIQGDFGSSVAVNSQGIEILSSASPIALPDWLVIAVLPTTEAFAPVHDMQQRIMWMSLAMHSAEAALKGLQLRLHDGAATVALFLRFANRQFAIMDAMLPSTFGIYLIHYIFVLWTQYALLNAQLPAITKAAIVFAVALSLSWSVTAALRRIPRVARIL